MQIENINSDNISDLTYKVVAYSEIPNYNTDECVDWAQEMIESGYNSEHLLILSALEKPTNYFETINYLNKAIAELGLKLKSDDEAVISYSSYFIKPIAKNNMVKNNLKKISSYFNSASQNLIIYDFYLLYWAWGDLDYGNENQEYWPSATASNIQQICTDYAIQWLLKNRKHYHQTINQTK